MLTLEGRHILGGRLQLTQLHNRGQRVFSQVRRFQGVDGCPLRRQCPRPRRIRRLINSRILKLSQLQLRTHYYTTLSLTNSKLLQYHLKAVNKPMSILPNTIHKLLYKVTSRTLPMLSHHLPSTRLRPYSTPKVKMRQVLVHRHLLNYPSCQHILRTQDFLDRTRVILATVLMVVSTHLLDHRLVPVMCLGAHTDMFPGTRVQSTPLRICMDKYMAT